MYYFYSKNHRKTFFPRDLIFVTRTTLKFQFKLLFFFHLCLILKSVSTIWDYQDLQDSRAMWKKEAGKLFSLTKLKVILVGIFNNELIKYKLCFF